MQPDSSWFICAHIGKHTTPSGYTFLSLLIVHFEQLSAHFQRSRSRQWEREMLCAAAFNSFARFVCLQKILLAWCLFSLSLRSRASFSAEGFPFDCRFRLFFSTFIYISSSIEFGRLVKCVLITENYWFFLRFSKKKRHPMQQQSFNWNVTASNYCRKSNICFTLSKPFASVVESIEKKRN